MKTTLSQVALAICLATLPACAHASEATAEAPVPILVIGEKQTETPAPATRVVTDAATIARTINAANVEDTLKYFPSLVVRKRHIGDNFAPIATRTSGLGASARETRGNLARESGPAQVRPTQGPRHPPQVVDRRVTLDEAGHRLLEHVVGHSVQQLVLVAEVPIDRARIGVELAAEPAVAPCHD